MNKYLPSKKFIIILSSIVIALVIIFVTPKIINYIKENYDAEIAQQLENRLLNSIRSQDPNKFIRGVRKLRGGNED